MFGVRGLSKRFGLVQALRGVDFSLEPGRITAMLGENGAGKTTAMKIVLGFLRPDSGSVEIGALRTGYVPDQPVFPLSVRGRELLDLTSRRAGWGPASAFGLTRRICAEILLPMDLLDRPPSTYSAGNRKKFAYLQSLLVDPGLLLADEPFSALDPPSICRIRDVLRGMADKGTSILLSSHLLSEMEKICDDYLLLRRGRVVARSDVPRRGPGLESVFLSPAGGC